MPNLTSQLRTRRVVGGHSFVGSWQVKVSLGAKNQGVLQVDCGSRSIDLSVGDLIRWPVTTATPSVRTQEFEDPSFLHDLPEHGRVPTAGRMAKLHTPDRACTNVGSTTSSAGQITRAAHLYGCGAAVAACSLCLSQSCPEIRRTDEISASG